jgi:23S rRNA pseudouridine1911/1915/1917 synthase
VKILQLRVEAQDSGQRLDSYLAAGSAGLTRTYGRRLISEGHVLVNASPSRPSYRIRAGDMIEVSLPPAAPSSVEAQDIPLAVLYEDDDVVVVDKPAGMPVHPSAGHSGHTLVNALLGRFPDIGPLSGENRPGIVHRLDKDTSGVMVVARTANAQGSLVRQMRDREVEKVYLALVNGVVTPAEGLIDAPLARDPRHRKRQAVVEGGRESRTAYRVLDQARSSALLDVRPETGRTHQIRVHLAAIGHPVLGDTVYGRRSDLIARQALHALSLGFRHPATAKRLAIQAEPPHDFVTAAEALGLTLKSLPDIA